MATTQYSSWSDLPTELLGLVLKQLPSLADRVRVRAVCRSWHTNAQLQPLLPPPLPCGEIHRMTIPHDACYRGSVDNWLFLVHTDGGCSLMNPFSKTMLQLPKLATIWHTGSDMSPDSLVAAMIIDGSSRSGICICQPPFATDIFRKNEYVHIYDIVFFNGCLYALITGKLISLEIIQDHKFGPQILSIKCICDNIDYLTVVASHDPRCFSLTWEYLVESVDRLLLVVRRVGFLSSLPKRNKFHRGHTVSFEVFEVDMNTNCCFQWRRINSLEGQALFIGKYSKSLPATKYGLPQEDCIYFTCDNARTCHDPSDPLHECGVFNMRNEMVMPLFPDTTVVQRSVGHGCPTWFFPSEGI
ncbi:hypothetical protein HU200_015230 [Digitaria exilis]|uniref:F-box domain-containing protein n=1 Tax=Digitaria exilis TaxID=1010633 RepID=A0A835KI92_9POAL|nr:hypothetical protein HU200_015230 [Digitaria exilis]